jgi:ankyrin repeat protein
VNAARNGDREALSALLRKGANVNAAEGDGSTALLWASYRDDLDSAGLLISAGTNVNACNDAGATTLWAASQNGSEGMVLLSQNHNVVSVEIRQREGNVFALFLNRQVAARTNHPSGAEMTRYGHLNVAHRDCRAEGSLGTN